MENAAEALKMAFAVFIFVLALSVSIFAFSSARETSDIVLHQSDITAFYDYQEYKKQGKKSENRIVGLDEIVPMLFRYCENSYTIRFKNGLGHYDESTGEFDTNIDNLDDLTIYISEEKDPDTGKREISTLSLRQEQRRSEGWTSSAESALNNLKLILSGKTYKALSGYVYNYVGNPLTDPGKRYVEFISSIPKDENDKNDTTLKMEITYVLIKN